MALTTVTAGKPVGPSLILRTLVEDGKKLWYFLGCLLTDYTGATTHKAPPNPHQTHDPSKMNKYNKNI